MSESSPHEREPAVTGPEASCFHTTLTSHALTLHAKRKPYHKSPTLSLSYRRRSMSGTLGPDRSLSSQLTLPTHPPIVVSLSISCSLTQLIPIVFFLHRNLQYLQRGGDVFLLLSGGSWWQRGACAANAAFVAYGSPFPLPPP
jgi:hypothetical protein